AENFTHPVKSRGAHATFGVKLLGKSVDRQFVARRRLWRPARLNVADGLWLDALLLRHRHMHGPFILRLPVLGGDEDRKFRKPARHAGLKPQVSTEFLRQFAERRAVQIDREGARELKLPARA